MPDYDIEKVKRVSKSSKTDYFKSPNNKKQKQQQQKKKKSSSFWDVPDQYTTEDNSDFNYDYLELEKKLEVANTHWGVENISEQIVELIKNHYQKLEKDNSNNNNLALFSFFYPVAKKSLKKGYHQAKKVLPPLPQDIQKIIIATYGKSIDKLKIWGAEDYNKNQNQQLSKTDPKTKIQNENLIKDISNLFIEQGIYLEEQKVHHPIINTKR